ncbi:MAG TPA: T9SS type A sorting domain-containing protein, partial [Hanamia sp.]|nr:T9SS type A sorting domain-containing protein [Hanamia sp.]
LSEGYHKLYARFLDNLGKWSLTLRRNMEVYKDENNKVLNGEYFFKTDEGFGNCTPVTFAAPSADGSFVINIPRNTIPAGADTLFVRVHDDLESRWSITRLFNVSVALPLTLLDFSAMKQLNTAKLHWQTTNEVNTAYFNVQRSMDASHFNNIGVVNAFNQSGVNDYAYEDNIADISVRLYYRLQQVDIDGRVTYSKIVSIDPDNTTSGLAIYPNPAKNYFNLISSTPEDLNGAEISIVDLAGHVLLKQSLSATSSQKISISSLAKGMYLIKIVKATGSTTQKLIKE